MIYYTYKASSNVVVGQFVQLSSDSEQVENHTTGETLGVCVNSYTSDDDGLQYAEVYAAGGGGRQAILNSSWDGAPSRFSVVNAKVEPVSSGGIGWLIPSLPRSSKTAGDSAYISIY